MGRSKVQYVIGVLPLLYIVGNLCFWLVPVIILSTLKAVIPLRPVRAAVYWLLVWIYALAVWCDDFLFFRLLRIELDVNGLGEIRPDQSYVVIANHQSWNDIFILQHLLARPPATVKFLVKRELIYLPIIGLICWAYDYPFLRRHSKEFSENHPGKREQDIQTIQGVVERLGRHPAAIVNLVEGTRYSAAKANARNSPYQHLLRPRAGGFAYILGSMGDRLSEVIDITIVYDCSSVSFWSFLSGACGRVVVRAEQTNIHDILKPDTAVGGEIESGAAVSWLNTAWREKDQQIGAIRRDLGLNP